ncbi:MAG TPA: hypothetical protein EYG88_12615 [Desulfocapsa sulfexigens]|nr:hypothetical protein [Desulfocapsa sulfexigens]
MAKSNGLYTRFQTTTRLASGIAATHKIIARNLGSSREVITRLLKDMERNGLIKTGRGSIELLGQEPSLF